MDNREMKRSWVLEETTEPPDQATLKRALHLDFQDKEHFKLGFPILEAWSSLTDKHPSTVTRGTRNVRGRNWDRWYLMVPIFLCKVKGDPDAKSEVRLGPGCSGHRKESCPGHAEGLAGSTEHPYEGLPDARKPETEPFTQNHHPVGAASGVTTVRQQDKRKRSWEHQHKSSGDGPHCLRWTWKGMKAGKNKGTKRLDISLDQRTGTMGARVPRRQHRERS